LEQFVIPSPVAGAYQLVLVGVGGPAGAAIGGESVTGVLVEAVLAAGETRSALIQVSSLPCYPNCDQSPLAPVLTANDFQCFLNAFVAGLQYSNCDGSVVNPVLTGNDFLCFVNSFVVGCP
jgi:hypothetical protein